MFGQILSGAGMVAAGLGGLFGKRPSLPGIDIGALKALGREQERKAAITGEELATSIARRLQELRRGIEPVKARYEAKTEQAMQDYLRQLTPGISDIYRQQLGQLQQATLGQLPQTLAQTREAMAAGGGLGRGVARAALASVPTQLATTYGAGAQQLGTEMLGRQLQALQDVYRQQLENIATLSGIDLNALQLELQYGTEADKEKARAILDALGRTAQMVSSGYGTQAQMAPYQYQTEVARLSAPWLGAANILGGLGTILERKLGTRAYLPESGRVF